MLADRTLLGITLAATFAAGTTAGWAVRDQKGDTPYRPTQATSVYATQLEALRVKGYDEQEMQDAVKLYQGYLNSCRHEWDLFVQLRWDKFEDLDRMFEEKRAGLEMRFRERTGRAPGQK